MSRSIVLVGGSAGSFRPVCRLLYELPPGFSPPVVLILHRLKTISTGFDEALSTAMRGRQVTEPFDKEPLQDGRIYLAPANYHLCFENEQLFSLNTDAPVQYSRPSIDIAFYSAAEKFGAGVTGIILSGANRDGVNGAARISSNGGRIIVQDPAECEVETMPVETIRKVPNAHVMPLRDIIASFVPGSKLKVQG